MLNNKTPWTDGLYGPEEWITEHDLKHWCFGGDGDDTNGGDDDVFNEAVEPNNADAIDSMQALMAEEEALAHSNTANTNNFDDSAMSALDHVSGMQNASLAGHSYGPGGTSLTSDHNAFGSFDEEQNEALGNTAQGVVDSYGQAVDDASNISSQIANLVGITSHASIDPETGLYGETTGFNAGPALSVIGGLIGGPVGYGIGAMKGLMTGNLVAAAEPTGILSKANSLSNVITGSPVIGPQYSGPGLQMHTPSHSPYNGPGLFDPGGVFHTPGGIIGAIGRQ